MPWFFSYGLGTDSERTRKDIGGWSQCRRAKLRDHVYTFTGDHPHYKCATSTLIPFSGGEVLGVAYEITDSQFDSLAEREKPYLPKHHKIVLENGEEVPAYTIEPEAVGVRGRPSENYLAMIRQGLSEHYPAELVQVYLKRALVRAGIGALLPQQRADSANFRQEHGIRMRRLFPWTVTNSAPFGSAWIQVEPGNRTQPHCHDEQETFIFLKGNGVINIDGVDFPVRGGDVLYLEPFSVHTVRPVGDDPVEFLCVWWDAIIPYSVTQVTEDGSLQLREAVA
jgi:mannose-6-phosphate isomerase-like protein (cupin superfamily)